MSSDLQVDAQTRDSAGPRPLGGNETPPPPQREQADTKSASENTQQKILEALTAFLVDKGLEASELRLGDVVINRDKLWLPVMRAGGYEAVTSGKQWAAIGRNFGPPKGMTDLSYRVKKAYETQLLPFETALRRGEIPGLSLPPELEAGARSGEGPVGGGGSDVRKAVKRECGPADTAGRGMAKRGRGRGPGGRNGGRGGRGGRGGPPSGSAGGIGLIGGRVLIKFNGESPDDASAYFIGTVRSFIKERHHIDFDDGDEEDINLSEEVWRLATAEDEAEARHNGGKVAMKKADPVTPEKSSGMQHTGTQAQATDMQQKADEASPPLGVLDQRDEMQDNKINRKQDADIVAQGSHYKVRQGVYEGQPCYEIYVMVGPMSKEDVKVKCWPEGQVRVQGNPHPSIEKWTEDPIEHKIQLPSPIDPYSAKALITLHGLLYISVTMTPHDSPVVTHNASPGASAKLT